MHIQLNSLLQKRWLTHTTVGAIALAGGAVAGYILGKRRGTVTIVPPEVKPWYDDISEDRIIVVKDPELEALFNDLSEEEKIKMEALLEEERRILAEQGKRAVLDILEVVPEEEVLKVNVFTLGDDSDWDYEVELSQREKDVPYILHQEEFINDEMDFRQETVTYYAGDDIMTDSTDTPIYGYQELMGELRFGHGSRDKNVVYIRNEKIHMEWEVLLSEGMFSQEVLGLQMEKDAEDDLKHSVQKFRRE